MNKSAPTQKQRKERARRQRMGIAVIQRPLNFIKSKDRTLHQEVQHMANGGDGLFVKGIARSFL